MNQKIITLSENFNVLAEKTINEELLHNKPSSTLKEYYRKCFEQAEIEGVPKQSISKIVRGRLNDIKTKKILKQNPNALESECLINDSWYFVCAAEAGVVDPSMVRNTVVDPVQDQENNSIYTGKNKRAIDLIRNIKRTCVILEHGFKELKDDKGNHIDIETIYTKKELDEFFLESEQIIKIITNSSNAKTIVPQNVQGIFKDTIRVMSGQLQIATTFLNTQIRMVKDLRKSFITKKQAGKFKRCLEPNQLPLYKPKFREEAIFMGFYGISCPGCDSWRVRENSDSSKDINLKCVDCDLIFGGYTVTQCKGTGCGMLFYVEELQEIIKTGKCPGCKKEWTLPQHLIKYAKSV